MTNEWISTKDRLPTLKQKVLLLVKGDIFVGWYDDTWESSKMGLKWATLSTGTECYECSGEADVYDDEVTHWMPLPKPPD